MNSSNTVLVGGILSGIATIYAYKRGFSVDNVITKLEENTEVVGEIIRQLYDLSIELLTKIYDFIKKIIEKVVFNLKLKIDDLRLS